jgi:hypothetical protein
LKGKGTGEQQDKAGIIWGRGGDSRLHILIATQAPTPEKVGSLATKPMSVESIKKKGKSKYY